MGSGAGLTPTEGSPNGGSLNEGRPGAAGDPSAGGSGIGPVAPGAGSASEGPPDPELTPNEVPLLRVPADDPNVQYSGRIDHSDPQAPTYSAPGVTVSARFRGTGISALLGDEYRYGSERGFHDIVVDGEITGKLAMQQGVERYDLAVGLTPSEHTVSIVKRTQASLGKSIFRGFEVLGELLEPTPKPDLAIEFIGDSITAGEGAEGRNGSADCGQNALGLPGGWGQPFHNANRSYGVVTARELGADYQLTAVSGIGLVRNYSQQYDARTMAGVYDLMFVEEMASVAWDHTELSPDIVVIALGTNDFSGGDAPPAMPRPELDVAMYAEAYATFVTKLRGYYPEAHIFALSSQLLGDSPTSTPATDLKDAIATVVARFNGEGDMNVHSFVTTQVAGLGCTGHPNVDQQVQLGRELATEIRRVLGL